jgi:hypothetical protein
MEKKNDIFTIFGSGRPGRTGRRQGGAREVIEEIQGPFFREVIIYFGDVAECPHAPFVPWLPYLLEIRK